MIKTSQKTKELFLLFIFIFTNFVIFLFSIDAAPLVVGADAGQYLRPARSLVDFGEFAMNPPGWTPEMGESRPFTFGTPLYSIFLAIPYYFFEQNEMFYASVIIMQCSVLYLIGWLCRGLLPYFNSGRRMLIHALVIFNPNSLITAHLIQSETLFTLFAVISILYMLKYVNHRSINSLIIVGASAGLLSLTRPAGLYFVYMVPIILITIELFFFIKNRFENNSNKGSSNNFLRCFIPVLVAFLVMSPWYARNYANSNEFFLTSASGAYLQDNYQTLIQRGRGLKQTDAYKISKDMQLNYFIKNDIDVICLTDERSPDCGAHVFDAVFSGVLNEPIKNHAKALFYSWGTLYLAGGASNLRNYIGLKGNSIIVAYHDEKFGFNSIITLIKRMKIEYLLIFIVFTSFALIGRITALIGLYRIAKNPSNIPNLIIILGTLLIFSAMYLYLGQSRFRVPIEPILMLLSVLCFKDKRNLPL